MYAWFTVVEVPTGDGLDVVGSSCANACRAKSDKAGIALDSQRIDLLEEGK